MTPGPSDTTVAEPLDAFLRSKAKGGTESGNYRRNCERVVREFLEWLDRRGEATTFADLDPRTFRRFARDLTTHDPTAEEPLCRRELTAGTVRTYYAQVSAYIGWCVREGYLDRNPAQQNVAKEPLPDDDGRRSGDQQAWTDDHRRAITTHVDRAVSEALDGISDDGELFEAVKPYRDRALVYVLCYSGVRGGELVADPKDDRRVGLRWEDVSLADSTLTVFSKNQRWSDRSLPSQALAAVDRYRTVLDPHPDWPVFPTLHYPSLYEVIRTGLSADGWAESSVEEYVDDLSGHPAIFETLREYDLSPPSMTTDGVRRTMRRLCADADIELDDRHGYLAPHGGRRGVGEVMVRQRGFTAAARLLDNSEAMVREHYSHIEAKDLAADAGSAFEEHDG
ncbi:Site-specific recombinase XerD [Halogranum rubrum]|uniref:Site-specific recombinase XerD n=1 Tax=Halogranum rubrum TaxID=553466 RepID=A0A1I4IN25_9EURY|nr:phage integrase SAM-like domain-containing protein [Halogranum rubrum]SFL55675.1 Site-specific recombinase XerD [Halogranum rubrum]